MPSAVRIKPGLIAPLTALVKNLTRFCWLRVSVVIFRFRRKDREKAPTPRERSKHVCCGDLWPYHTATQALTISYYRLNSPSVDKLFWLFGIMFAGGNKLFWLLNIKVRWVWINFQFGYSFACKTGDIELRAQELNACVWLIITTLTGFWTDWGQAANAWIISCVASL